MNRTLRLLLVLNASDRSESAIWNGLHKRGIEVNATCSPAAPQYKTLIKSDFPVMPLLVRTRLDLRAASILRKKIKTFDPDIIYAPTNRTLSASLFASGGTRTKVFGYRGTIGHLSYLDPAAWLTYLHPRLRHIVCVSMAVERYLREEMRMPAGRVTTIYKGHDPAWYSNQPNADLTLFNIPANAYTVAFAGNMRPVKGVDVLLRSLRLLPPDSPLHLLLIGDIRDKKVLSLSKEPNIASRAHFTGYRTDAPALINASDAFVMPSVEREGLPRAVFEAMALEKPVIVSDVGGMPEQILHNQTGLVIPPSNEKALAEAMTKLAADPDRASQLGKAGYNRLNENFHISRTIDAFEALLHKMCSNN